MRETETERERERESRGACTVRASIQRTLVIHHDERKDMTSDSVKSASI
jgi:hypothetical protein